ncbi:transposase [Thiopseudomonas alkaliphila]|nr:transposase [Thiopseudomonas alkaliphila]
MHRLTLKRRKPKSEVFAIILYMEEIIKRYKFTEAQIVSILKLAEQEVKVTDICREYEISNATYYHWM